MDVSVMLEKVKDNRYRATALMPASVIAEAPTREEAVDRIRVLIRERLAHAELIQLEVCATGDANPWLAMAGTWRDHPDIDEVVENINAYRPRLKRIPTGYEPVHPGYGRRGKQDLAIASIALELNAS